ncbi:MAG: hypothetical protein ACI8ZM_002314 [Crocinitomix sp.]|jgi:hypothetical protein
MKLRSLLLIICFANFASYSQDTLATDSCTFFMSNTITADCEDYGCQFLQFYLDCELEEFHIIVLNRWGEIIYESTDRDELWDPSTVLNKDETVVWEIKGKVLRNDELVEVKWQGDLTFLR